MGLTCRNQRTASWLADFPSLSNWLSWCQGHTRRAQFNTVQYTKYSTKQLPSVSPAGPPANILPDPVHLSVTPGHPVLRIPILFGLPPATLGPLLAALGVAGVGVGVVTNACSMQHQSPKIFWRNIESPGQIPVTCLEDVNTWLPSENLVSLAQRFAG